tara:strand:+ start:4098 stop:6569 length:2472 start_codon:yes stop_codon:yes gene_type:complete
MAKNLVIVESPAKAKTIERFLGDEYKVSSSFGHIADLPSNELGVDVDSDFSPKYIVSEDKKKIVKELKSLAKNAQTVWLASDEDREGEAIAWHLSQQLDLDSKKIKRIVFHEITKNAILNAIKSPRLIDENLVNAQQARRVLDRLVGYNLSPVLWKKVKGGLSAGRVQSVAVRLIVEKERLIQDFIPQELYRTIAIFETNNGKSIRAQFKSNQKNRESAFEFLKKNIDCSYSVADVEKKPVKKSPTSPFTTSTLQQEASRKLYFSVSKTMTLAQKLYESGLITYMRTDSVNLSKEAQNSTINQIQKLYGSEFAQARNYKTKNKSAQEAHEAIRPTDISKIKISADYDQVRLYELIWKRTMSSQMSDAKLERTQLKIKSSNYEDIYSATGEVIIFEGFLKVYIEGTDDDASENQGILPNIKNNEPLFVKELKCVQKFTKPSARYSEAALVKKLEELGIGRPSTYAPTISTIQNRGYVQKGDDDGSERKYNCLTLIDGKINEEYLAEKVGSNKGKIIPTDIGFIVNDFLVNNFKNILDYNFTAEVEQSFDRIADGNQRWKTMLKNFYSDFQNTVDHVKENAKRESGERILGNHPDSGRVVKVRLGKFGPLAQIGTIDDDEKPQFASLNPDHKLNKITLDEVLDLFKLPKTIGEYKGESVTVNNGRYGPYIKYGKTFVSIKKGVNPSEVDYDTALDLIEEKNKLDAPIHSYDCMPVTKGKGRFGPFIKWNNLFINVNKKYDYDNLQPNDIEELIIDKLKKEKEKIISNWESEGIRIEKARWGRSNIIKGKIKIELPKTVDPLKINLDEAKQKIALFSKNKKKSKQN